MKNTLKHISRTWGRITVFILILLISDDVRAQIYYTESGKITDTAELFQMFRKAFEIRDSHKEKLTYTQLYILEANGNKYLTVDGLFNVYEWKEGRWNNMYFKSSSGYNNISRKFVWNNEIYSFGGYGYWKSHGDLIKYLWDKNEWEMVAYGDQVPVGNGFTYFHDSTLNVINPVSYTDAYIEQKKKSGSFTIDMKTLKTKDLDIDFPVDFLNKRFIWIETPDHAILAEKPMYLINKKNAEVLIMGLDQFNCLRKYFGQNFVIYTKNDSLFVFDQSMKQMCSYDIPHEIKDYKTLSSSGSNTSFLLGFGLLAIVLSFVSFYYVQRKKEFTDTDHVEVIFEEPKIRELQKISGSTISAEELDQILGIQDITHGETQRFKRSQMINTFNQETLHKTGKELITRVQDPEDKRRFLYKINSDL